MLYPRVNEKGFTTMYMSNFNIYGCILMLRSAIFHSRSAQVTSFLVTCDFWCVILHTRNVIAMKSAERITFWIDRYNKTYAHLKSFWLLSAVYGVIKWMKQSAWKLPCCSHAMLLEILFWSLHMLECTKFH